MARNHILPTQKTEDRTVPDIYRGLILVFVSKLYTSILNNRSSSRAQECEKKTKEQADNVFVLSALIQKQLSKRRGRFDVALKAFDSDAK